MDAALSHQEFHEISRPRCRVTRPTFARLTGGGSNGQESEIVRPPAGIDDPGGIPKRSCTVQQPFGKAGSLFTLPEKYHTARCLDDGGSGWR